MSKKIIYLGELLRKPRETDEVKPLNYNILKKELENKDYDRNKIELLSCRSNGNRCKNHLALINEEYTTLQTYLPNKEYQKSIEALDKAFHKTFELQEDSCSGCAKMFRSTIIQSLEDIHLELKGMSQGIFKTNRYKASYILVDNVLRGLKQHGIQD